MKCPPPEGEDVSGDGAGEFSVCLIPSFMCLWVGFSAAAMATSPRKLISVQYQIASSNVYE
jgi:hypothetical protein